MSGWKDDTERLDELLAILEHAASVANLKPAPENVDNRDARVAFAAFTLGVISLEAGVLRQVRKYVRELAQAAAEGKSVEELVERSRRLTELLKIGRDLFTFRAEDYGA